MAYLPALTPQQQVVTETFVYAVGYVLLIVVLLGVWQLVQYGVIAPFREKKHDDDDEESLSRIHRQG